MTNPKLEVLAPQNSQINFSLRNRALPNRRGVANMPNLVSAMGIAVIFAVPLAVGAADLKADPAKDEVVCVSGPMDATGNEGEEVCFKRSDLNRAKLPSGAAQAAKAKGTPVVNYRVQAAQKNSDKPAQ